MQVVLVYLEWIRRSSLLKCVLQPKIAENSLKDPILGVQCRSRSLMLVPLETSSAVLVMISSKSVSICNRFHARWANSGKITISKGVPLFDALCRRLGYILYSKLWNDRFFHMRDNYVCSPDSCRNHALYYNYDKERYDLSLMNLPV